MLKPAVETKYPYRADVVGSLLRPQAIFQARADKDAGKITAQQLYDMLLETKIAAPGVTRMGKRKRAA